MVDTVLKTIENKLGDNFGTVMVEIAPNWNESTGVLDNFTASVYVAHGFDYQDVDIAVDVKIPELIDLLFGLRCHHIDNYVTEIYFPQDDCDNLMHFYKDMINELDTYEGFTVEIELD